MWILELLALAVYAPLVLVVHELGHAALARTAGYRVVSFGIGSGRPLLKFRLPSGAVLYLAPWIPLGGRCTAIPTGPSPRRASWILAGGLIAQGALALLLWTLPQGWVVLRVIEFNFLVAVTNAVPWRLGAYMSDGARLLDLVRGGQTESFLLTRKRELEDLLAVSEATGAASGETYARVVLAWVHVLSGRATEAGLLLQNMGAVADPWLETLRDYVTAEWHRLEGRPLAALHIARHADHDVDDEALSTAVALMKLAEARALVDVDAPDQAQRALVHLVGLEGWIGRQASAVLLSASLEGETEDLELATWRVLRRARETWLDPADAVHALWSAAIVLEERNRHEAARGARAAASQLAQRAIGSVPAEDAPALRARLGPAAGFQLSRAADAKY